MQHEPVGVIGLGLLGTALAERLLGAGFRVHVHNRTRSKAEPLMALGAEWSDNPLVDCTRVVVCLFTTEVVRQVLFELGGMRAGQIVVDTSTGNPRHTEQLGRKLAKQQVDYLECPIAGSSDQTRRGTALAWVAGPRQAFDTALSVISAIAPSFSYLGSWGNASRMKLVNNLVLGLNRAALAEGLAFAQAMGLDLNHVLDLLKQGNAYSVVMDTKGEKMVNGDFATQAKLEQHLKDVRLMQAEGQAVHASLPFSQLHAQLLEQLVQSGYGELDNCAIIKAFPIAGPDGIAD